MKTKLFTMILLIFTSSSLFCQFQIDAGKDTIICGSNESLRIGGSPTATGGVEPYTFSWSTEFKDSYYQYHASQFLNDTTIANPILVHPSLVSNKDEIKFCLTVKDKNGLQLKDSVVVKVSVMMHTAVLFFQYINVGDTVSLHSNLGPGMGIGPLKYSWTPNYNISDTSAFIPLAWPAINTTYEIVATDSIGCRAYDKSNVWIKPLNVSSLSNSKSQSAIFPNPINSSSVISIDKPVKETLTIKVFNSKGQIVLQDKMNDKSYNVGNRITQSGNYIYIISKGSEIIASGQFVKE